MATLDDHIRALTEAVVRGAQGLDEALNDVERWLDAHAPALSEADRDAFSATLDRESNDDNTSLVDSVLRMHATRLLYRYDEAASLGAAARGVVDDAETTPYSVARDQFNAALRQSESGIREARIDIAIANAHHLLGDMHANREWLDSALAHVQPLASLDLVRLADAIPSMPAPRMGALRRIGLRLLGVNLERLAERNRASFHAIAQMQMNQVVLLAHLIGASFEALRERPRSRRAYRVAAHLVVRYEGLLNDDAAHALAVAEDIRRAEPEAAALLARQAAGLYRAAGDAAGQARAEALLALCG